MKLAPGKQIFWRDLDCAQLGLAPETSISLADFSRAEHSLIGELEKELTLTEFKIAAQKLKVNVNRAQEILDFLITSGALIENSDFLLNIQNSGLKVALDFPVLSEFCTQFALDLAQFLPIQITTSDEGYVNEEDHYLLRKAGLHLKKSRVFPQLLQEIRSNNHQTALIAVKTKGNKITPQFYEAKIPHTDTHEKVQPTNAQAVVAENHALNLAIVHGSYAPNPLLIGKLLAAGKTVINLWTEENTSFLGPIFEPLSSPCPNCLHQIRLAEDPGWHNLAPQAFLAPPLKVHPFSKQILAHELQLVVVALIFEKKNLLKEKIRGYPDNSESVLANKSLESTALEIAFKAPQSCNCHTLI